MVYDDKGANPEDSNNNSDESSGVDNTDTPQRADAPAKEIEKTDADQEPTLTGKGDSEDTDKKEIKPSVSAIDGLDPRIFSEDGNFDKGKASEVFREYADEKAKYEKQVKDFRRIIGQGKAPENASDYLKGYEPDEKVARYYDLENKENDNIKRFLIDATNTFKDIGLKKDQGAKVLDIINNAMVDSGVFDARSDKEIKESKELWIGEQKKTLNETYGEGNAETVIATAVKFVENVPTLNEDEKILAIDLMNTKGAGFINLFYKMNKNFGEGDIPVEISTMDGVPSDAELWDEYNNKDTTDRRRDEIIRLRAKANRKGSLYINAKK